MADDNPFNPKRGVWSSRADRPLSATQGPTGTSRPPKGRHVPLGPTSDPFAYIYISLEATLDKNFAGVVMASGGSSSGKGFGLGRGKGARKGPPIVWPSSIGHEDFLEAVYEFPVESRGDFTKDSALRGYDNRRKDWPKCMHGEDCLMQMCTKGTDGGRRFFKCPRAWVILSTKGVLDMFNMYCMIYIICCVSGIQCSRELRVRTMG